MIIIGQRYPRRQGHSGQGVSFCGLKARKRFFKLQVLGKPGDALLFIHADGKPWGASHQKRPFKAARTAAEVDELTPTNCGPPMPVDWS